MKIVVLSDLSDFGMLMLADLADAQIAVEVVVTQQRAPALVRLRRLAATQGLGGAAGEILRRVRASFRSRRRPAAQPPPKLPPIVAVSGFNAPDCVELLGRMEPDLIVLGGAPILKEPVLQTARLGVLNAHPGLLPKYRGVDVVPWAILNGDPVGVTVHRVDKGIDTGLPIRSQEVEIRGGDTLDRIRERASAISTRLMASVVGETVARGAIPEVRPPQDTQRYPLCKRMPPELVRQAEKRLRLLSSAAPQSTARPMD